MRTQIKFAFLVSVTLIAGQAGAQESIPTFDSARLERLDAYIQGAIDRKEIPGAVVVVTDRDGVVHHTAMGSADIDTGRPMTEDSIFRIASMTKAITTVAVMQLYERGHFMLGDPVAEYIPAFAEMNVISEVDEEGNVTATVPATKPIRIIDLLTHTSGIGYPFIPTKLTKTYADAGIWDGLALQNMTLEDQMLLLAEQPILFEPGSAYMYGLNTDLLGYLVEVISGQTLEEYFYEHIFDPLGMVDTHFYLPEDSADRLVTLHAWVEGEGLRVSDGTESDIKLDDTDFPNGDARSFFSGGGGLSGTAQDYAVFTRMLLNDGELDGVRILSRKSVELMREPRFDANGDGIKEISLGLFVVTDMSLHGELGTLGTYSWGGAFETSFFIDPVEGISAVFMTQARPHSTNIRNDFDVLVYQALN